MPVLVLFGVDLTALIIGLAALLLLLAGWVVFKAIALLFQKVPLVGSTIANTVFNKLADVMKQLGKDLDPFVKGFAVFLATLGLAIWRFMYYTVRAVRNAKNEAIQARLDAQNAYIAAVAQANIMFQRAEQDSFDNLVAADNYAVGLFTGLTNQIAILQNEITNLQNGTAGVSQGYVDFQVNQLRAELNTDVNTINNTLTQDNLGFQTQLNTDVSTINATITRDVTDLTNQLNGVTASIPGITLGEIGALTPGIIAQAAAQLAPELNAIKTEVTQCLDPLCDTVTPQAKRLGHLGNLLQGLELLAVEAIIVALAAECLTNPRAVVDDISTVVTSVGGGVMAGFRDLVGA